MSLKNFHIFFIVFSAVASWATAYLFLSQAHEGTLYLVCGIACCVAGVVLPAYGVWFYRKMVRQGFYK
jgi:Na+/proline symporter